MPAPECSLTATFDAEADKLTLVCKSDAETVEITGVSGPGGVGVGGLQGAGAMRWTLSPTADGSYGFEATATTGKRSSTCKTSVQVVRKKPTCNIDTRVDPETNVISLDASRSEGEFSLTGVTLPDGTAGSVSELQSTGAQSWTFDPSATLKRKPGDYTYVFAGQATLHGFEDNCDATVVITREAPDYRWIARGYYAGVYPSSERATLDEEVGGIAQSTQVHFSDRDGFGLDLEYLLKPNVGLVFSAILASMDSEIMFDREDVWLMGDDDVDFNVFSLGVNYHLSPHKRADFFIGAFVGLVQFDDVDFDFAEVARRVDFDFDDDFGFGVNAGVDIPFQPGSGWIFTAGLRYMLATAEAENAPFELDVDPLIGTVGFGYRF
jgi:outer membrane protein W